MAEQQIKIGDPRHTAALKALAAMHDYWKLDPSNGAVQWIEDTSGRVIIFTRRRKYKDVMLRGITENIKSDKDFEIRKVEMESYLFSDV